MEDKITIVVTGANGFVGSHLVDALLKKQYTVKAIVRKNSNTKYLDGKNIELLRIGLSDIELLKTAFTDANYIYHIAGVVKGRKEEDYFKGNVDTTKNVLEAAKSAKNLKRILITSSIAASGPALNGPKTEAMPCEPLNSYGRSKLAQEKLAQDYMDVLPITIVRPPAVYGERDGEILIFFKTLSRGILMLIGFGKKTFSLVYVKDLVKGMMMAAESNASSGETYFLGSDQIYNWDDFGSLAAKFLGKKPIKIRIPHFAVYGIGLVSQLQSYFKKTPSIVNIGKANEITKPSWTCSSAKAKQDFGYIGATPTEEGLQATFDWYKKEGWL